MNTDPLITTLIDLAKAMNRPDFKIMLGDGLNTNYREFAALVFT